LADVTGAVAQLLVVRQTMRRLSSIEFGILLLALLFIIVGIEMLWHPKEAVVIHQVYRHFGYKPEYISKTGARVYGVLSLLCGLGLMRLTFFGKSK
jgi:hypothetical protein